jgi:signal transduction histidine kinase
VILRKFLKLLGFLTIRQKLILTICGCTLLAVIVTSSIILDQAARVIDRELINQGTIIATNLCKQSIEPILHEGYWEVYKNVKTVTSGTYLPFMKYIVIQDREGKILAHSRPQHFRLGERLPEGPFEEKAFGTQETLVQSKALSKRERLYDVTVPCRVNAEKLAIVRVGFTDERLRKEISDIKRNVVLFGLLISTGGIGLSVAVAYRITGPLQMVTENIIKISKGELKEVFPVETDEKDEVGRMVDIFNEMAKNLKTQKEMDEHVARKDKLIMLGEFSAGIAHEIKNPLTSIKMLMQTAKEKRDPLCHEDFEVIEAEINRIDRIVGDFLAFARPTQAEYIAADLNDILQEVVLLIKTNMEQSGIRFEAELLRDMPKVLVSPDGIKQVFLNVVLNAVQAMEHGGTLRVGSTADDKTVVIAIADTGPGISDEDLKHIFDPFFTTKKEGTGMGLAITDRIIREHGGSIRVQTAPNRGTTMSIILPR